MPLRIGQVTFDCTGDASTLARFWSDLLELPVDQEPQASEFFASVGRGAGAQPALFFIRVPDKTPGKNVVHLDLVAPDRAEQVQRAIGLGAEPVADFDEYGATWTTLRDPEGNLFDIGG
ncbi:VOC family protein [Aldersonia sp. NBC_00410]|uniref:VOC family protein n=1 Tax=Aldersonia sp. NBC_00410 TaxID=2975954 RepID=UPI00225B7689|nr:VOC family protein [Aldersonia sp. NBC_00410]MCX5043080.1 VOC family protein [Aldersonia sp. NBC_00410]